MLLLIFSRIIKIMAQKKLRQGNKKVLDVVDKKFLVMIISTISFSFCHKSSKVISAERSNESQFLLQSSNFEKVWNDLKQNPASFNFLAEFLLEFWAPEVVHFYYITTHGSTGHYSNRYQHHPADDLLVNLPEETVILGLEVITTCHFRFQAILVLLCFLISNVLVYCWSVFMIQIA